MDEQSSKVELKYAGTESGGQSVITLGTMRMQEWYAISWATQTLSVVSNLVFLWRLHAWSGKDHHLRIESAR